MKTTGLALAAMAATATALPTFNIRSSESSHIHVEFEDLGYRSAQSGHHDSETAFYQVSTGESLFQLTTGERSNTLQYLDHAPLTSKAGRLSSEDNMLQMKAAGQIQARIAGHEALHSHPVFQKYIAKLSQAAGKEGMQGNTHPAVAYLHQIAMQEMKRMSPNAHPHKLHGISGVPTNLEGFSQGDEFVYAETSESFLQEMVSENDNEEWGGVAGVVTWVAGAVVAVVNGVIGGVTGVVTTIWDTVTGVVNFLWEAAVHIINIYQSLTGGAAGGIPIAETAKYAWWNWGPWTPIYGNPKNHGRRRRRRRQLINNLGQQYRPYFDNQNRMWSRLARCLDGLAMPSGSPDGSPCFGICGPGCVCFIWQCGSCLRAFQGCWEHDCACMKSCSNGGNGGAAWDAYICWWFTANLSTCAGIGCIQHLCANDNNADNTMDTYRFDDGDCTNVAFHTDSWSGTDDLNRFGKDVFTDSSGDKEANHYGAYMHSEYVVWGVNFPKRGPGGILCWEGPLYSGPAAGPNWDTSQSGWAGGGSFHPDEPNGIIGLCYTLQGKTAMKSEQEVDGFRPYGDVFTPTLQDLQDLGYHMPTYGFNFPDPGMPEQVFAAQSLFDKINTAVKWPGCGIDSARGAMNYEAATDYWAANNGGSWASHVGGDKHRMFTRGGGVNYRMPYDGSYQSARASFAAFGNPTSTLGGSEANFHCVAAHTKYAWTDAINTRSPSPEPTPYPTSYPTAHPTHFPTAHHSWGPCCVLGFEGQHYNGLYGLIGMTTVSTDPFNVDGNMGVQGYGPQPYVAPTDACAWHSDTHWMPPANIGQTGGQVYNGDAHSCRAQEMKYVTNPGSGGGSGDIQRGFCLWYAAGTDSAIQCPGIMPHTLPTVSPTGFAQAPGTKDAAAS